MKIQDNILYGPPTPDVENISLGQHVFNNLRANGDHVLQVDIQTGKRLTYRDVLERSMALTNFMRAYGINVEDRVSVASENHPNYVVIMCSTLFAGATFAPLNPTYTEREYRHMLEILEPRLIFVSQRTEKQIAKIASSLNWSMKLVAIDDTALDANVVTLKEILEEYAPNPNTFVPTQIDDSSKRMAVILCSSGTTGFPKGVMLSHRNLAICLHNTRCPSAMDFQQGDRVLVFLPLFHGFAFQLISVAIFTGAMVYLMRNFSLQTFLTSMQTYKITHLPLVPPVLVSLSKDPSVLKYDFSSVRQIICGAAPFVKEIADEVMKRTKVKCIRNGYGMTELTLVSNLGDRTSNDDNVGRPLPSFRCKVIDAETGRTLGPREIGEICFAGDQLMLGYFKNAKTTAETIDKDNWLHTGDLGYFNEEGYLYITGRLKELIKYKGFQVSPSEIEAILLKHASVKDVAVVGKPDEISGEIPMAFVVKQPNADTSAEEIVEFANRHLSPQKWLRGGVKFIERIPKTPSGKILRRELLNYLSKL